MGARAGAIGVIMADIPSIDIRPTPTVLYEHYCQIQVAKRGVTLDTTTGWLGRQTGSAASIGQIRTTSLSHGDERIFR